MASPDLDGLLRGVSRSFYLSLRVLPPPIRPQISLAYLLARASDTVADTQAVPREKRLHLLGRMREGDFRGAVDLAEGQAQGAERALLERLGECSAALTALEPRDQERVRSLLETIVSGQIFDLERFPGDNPRALANDEELDRYTYMVAGCVGEFWTRMCVAHLPDFGRLDQEEMVRLGIRLGKGLQLVNVLRDMAADLRIGRCYLPIPEPGSLLDPASFDEARPVYAKWLDRALDHLDAGWAYALRIPASLWRVRLACLWPIWIGLGTIALLRRANPLDPAQRVMVPQSKVYLLLARSMTLCRSDRLLDRTYRSLREEAA